jgi:uncharacterized protein YndB with AHSA1/START domain
MERKTKITATDGMYDIHITREFELPVELVFKAHAEPELFEEWMSHEYGKTKVLKYEAEKQGSWEFQTSDPAGNVVFKAYGVFHDFIPDKKITRTFEMENGPFGPTLEFLEFEKITEDTCRLNMQVIYRSAALRDQMLKLPFAQGLDMAHNRLQEIIGKLKKV